MPWMPPHHTGNPARSARPGAATPNRPARTLTPVSRKED